MAYSRRIVVSVHDSIDQRFPGAVKEGVFVSQSYDALSGYGFSAANAIACVGVCRDELCRPLVGAIQGVWGEAFNFSSLGGQLTLGAAGFRAAHAHAPVVKGRERYVYFVMPHIGIGAGGEFGETMRVGRQGPSAACGALTAVLAEIQEGPLDLDFDPDNIEYSALKRQLAGRLAHDEVSDIATLTVLMADIVFHELERMIQLTLDPEVADYAVFTGVQIHAPAEDSLVWVDHKYVCVDGKRHVLDF